MAMVYSSGVPSQDLQPAVKQEGNSHSESTEGVSRKGFWAAGEAEHHSLL